MNNEISEKFCRHIADLWGGHFEHRYCIPHGRGDGAWRRWREIEKHSPNEWYCNSIKEAAAHYSWKGDDASQEFENLSLHLKAAVLRRDENAAYKICLSIFKWGGVGNSTKKGPHKSRLWLQNKNKERDLCDRLEAARFLLTNEDANLDTFDGDYLQMNSAMTKVYAALDPSRLIIYDGRVGAALGLLAKDYLKSIGHHHAVPDELAFPWGGARTSLTQQPNKRDPSEENLHFRRLFQSGRDKYHAQWMRHTSGLLRKVVAMVTPSSSCDLASLEKALFMIGYNVSRS